MTIHQTGNGDRNPSSRRDPQSNEPSGSSSPHRPETSPGTDAYRVLARRAAARYVRQLATRQHRQPTPRTPRNREPVAGADPDRVRRLWSVLDGELDRLPDECRSPIVLCCLERRTIDEAGTLLAWSRDKVQRNLDRGWHRLRKRLAQQGVCLSSKMLVRLLRRDVRPGSVSASLLTGTMRAATQAAECKAGALTAVSRWVAWLARRSLKFLDER